MNLRKINSAQIIPGDMFISPPGFCRQYRWNREVETLHILVDPLLMNSPVEEFDCGDRWEILPSFKIRSR